jgi:4-hydroxy-3-methylbut-2-enyl diphosphate reductase
LKVILDPQAGTCGGVRRAIQLAEKELEDTHETVLVLGDIIHNEREVERLDKAGLRTIHTSDLDHFDTVINPGSRNLKVLVRAHGEPPETFEKLTKLGVDVVDGTCPVVTRSQDLAREYNERGYQVAIVGKHHHPEIIGIVGHAENKAFIVQYDEDIQQLTPGLPTMVMTQTTVSPAWFDEMTDKIRQRVGEVVVKDTLCRFVVRRDQKLPSFATQADVILVVGGHKSSNTKMLHATCKAINPRSYHVVSVDELESEWFEECETIGVTGSASTPLWLLNEFMDTLERWIASGWPKVVMMPARLVS